MKWMTSWANAKYQCISILDTRNIMIELHSVSDSVFPLCEHGLMGRPQRYLPLNKAQFSAVKPLNKGYS